MAKLQVTADLLLHQLFDGFQPAMDVSIRGASFDPARGVVELDIEGPSVPKCERVRAVITQRAASVKFEPSP